MEFAVHSSFSTVGWSNFDSADLADGQGIQPVSDNSSTPERLRAHALPKMARVVAIAGSAGSGDMGRRVDN